MNTTQIVNLFNSRFGRSNVYPARRRDCGTNAVVAYSGQSVWVCYKPTGCHLWTLEKRRKDGQLVSRHTVTTIEDVTNVTG